MLYFISRISFTDLLLPSFYLFQKAYYSAAAKQIRFENRRLLYGNFSFIRIFDKPEPFPGSVSGKPLHPLFLPKSLRFPKVLQMSVQDRQFRSISPASSTLYRSYPVHTSPHNETADSISSSFSAQKKVLPRIYRLLYIFS